MTETIVSSGPADGDAGEYKVVFSSSGEVRLSFDEVCVFGLYEEEKEIDVSCVCGKILENRIKKYVLPYCVYCRRTEAQIIRKVKGYFCGKNGYSGIWDELLDPAIENVLAYLREEGFAGDDAYCAAFFKTNSEKDVSSARLVMELKNRGVDGETAERAAKEAARDDEEACRKALEKKLRGRSVGAKNEFDAKEKASLYRFLSSRGFETGLVLRVLNDYFRFEPDAE
ncbi:MAG: regulatory protein RecX [Clostridia bacterium]|nr:regulatory protein RecX [Clostridia bacterium]